MPKHIWLPSRDSQSIEWFVEKDTKLATGIEAFREEWIQKEVRPRHRAGFRAEMPYDPERDEFDW
jgi:hypothetical protein